MKSSGTAGPRDSAIRTSSVASPSLNPPSFDLIQTPTLFNENRSQYWLSPYGNKKMIMGSSKLFALTHYPKERRISPPLPGPNITTQATRDGDRLRARQVTCFIPWVGSVAGWGTCSCILWSTSPRPHERGKEIFTKGKDACQKDKHRGYCFLFCKIIAFSGITDVARLWHHKS